MRAFLRKLLLLAALGAATWLVVLRQWYATRRVVTAEDVALYLLALPLALFAFVLTMRWAVQRGMASAQAAAVAAGAAPAARTTGQVPSAQPATPCACPLLGAWVHTPAGAEVEALRSALAEGAPRPVPDARLRDADGLPLLSARIAALDVAPVEATLAASGLPPPSPALSRALAALAPLLDPAVEPLRMEAGHLAAAPLSPAVPTPVPPPGRFTAASQGPLPRLQVLVHWPAPWSAAEAEAAQSWLQTRLQTLLAGVEPPCPWTLQRVLGGGVELLAEAVCRLEALQGQEREGCVLVLACHSDLDEDAVLRLEREQRLFALPRRPQGVMPGEAAAALLLSSRPTAADGASPQPAVALRGFQVSRTEAEAVGRKGVRAALQGLLERSLASAGLDASHVTTLAGDAAQHTEAAATLYALAQADLTHLDPLDDVRLPGTLCGHTGAVAALLAVALAWDRCRQRGEAALALALSETPWWMAGVLVPFSTPADQMPTTRKD
jgi:hypothetical protein